MKVNILEFGADTKLENNAPAIQSAINKAYSCGGGTVVIPSGKFISGSIFLKDNIELFLESGAILKASEDPCTYNSLDAYPQNYFYEPEGWDFRHLIIAHNAKNVAIRGLGRIEGCAEKWYGAPSLGGKFLWRDGFQGTRDHNNGVLRPGQLIVFVESSDIKVSDITIADSTCWSCFFHGCVNVGVHGVKIFNNRLHANTDGLDIDSCQNVTVSDCIIDTGDDCIAIRGCAQRLTDKSAVCENITITNCVLSCSVDAIRLGVGYGKIRRVRISNIVVHYAGQILELCTSYFGSGHCEIDDIGLCNISAENVARALCLTTENVSVSRLSIENLRTDSMAGSYIKAGAREAMKDISLVGVDIYMKPLHLELDDKVRAARGEYFLECENISDLHLERVRYFSSDELKPLWKGEETVINCNRR